jgi:hypothetical protein
MRPEEVAELLPYLTATERAELEKLLAQDRAIWRPLPGPQTMAYESEADVLGYGGAAGGGKTDLSLGKVLMKSAKAAIFRREATQLTGIIDRLSEMLGTRDGYNGQEKIWRNAGPRGVQIEFGSVPNVGDETKHQGRPKDTLVLDEASNFLEAQARFLMGWVRTTKPGQKTQTILPFNPPTTAEGRWLIKFFAPWLDDKHPNPAQPGELRWFATIDGEDREVDDGTPFVLNGEKITPQSRTFIPSRITDNPYLLNTGYMAQLQSMPEPLRSQMLYGDFKAGLQDDPWQVIPTEWIDAAMDRWQPRHAKGAMDSLGVDVARGGRDSEIIARRHGTWFDELLLFAGKASPDGPTTAGRVIAARRDRAVVHIDVVGWGSSPYDFLVQNRVQTVPLNGAAKSYGLAKDNDLRFVNLRAELWWRMREALDPMNPEPIALPDDSALRADLAAPKWSLGPAGIKVEAKEDIVKRIGRSPDRGDAVVYALVSTPKQEFIDSLVAKRTGEYDPFSALGAR